MKNILILLLLSYAQTIIAQKYQLKSSRITFFSSAPIEDIKAVNTKSSSIFDTETGQIVFSVPINAFQFDKSLMQQHFNEEYLESDKYPRSTFQGKIIGFEPGKRQQQVRAKGKLTIHGATHEIEVPGSVRVYDDRIEMMSVFTVKLVDYNIKIPALLWKNIAEEIEISIDLTYATHDN